MKDKLATELPALFDPVIYEGSSYNDGIVRELTFRLVNEYIKLEMGTVNVAINVPVDNKKNAFFGVPFEVIIWDN